VYKGVVYLTAASYLRATALRVPPPPLEQRSRALQIDLHSMARRNLPKNRFEKESDKERSAHKRTAAVNADGCCGCKSAHKNSDGREVFLVGGLGTEYIITIIIMIMIIIMMRLGRSFSGVSEAPPGYYKDRATVQSKF
jgi:hypothetical protein